MPAAKGSARTPLGPIWYLSSFNTPIPLEMASHLIQYYAELQYSCIMHDNVAIIMKVCNYCKGMSLIVEYCIWDIQQYYTK